MSVGSALRGTLETLYRIFDVQWKRESASAFGARDDADAAYINVRGADAIIDDDFITRRQFIAGVVGIPAFSWHDPGGVVSGSTRFMSPDANPTATNDYQPRLGPSGITLGVITVRATVGPGAARTDTWTLMQNGVATGLVISLTGAATEATVVGPSVVFAATDKVSMRQVTAAASTTTDPVVSVYGV